MACNALGGVTGILNVISYLNDFHNDPSPPDSHDQQPPEHVDSTDKQPTPTGGGQGA